MKERRTFVSLEEAPNCNTGSMSFPLSQVSARIQMSAAFSDLIFGDSILQFPPGASKAGEGSCAWPGSLPAHTQLEGADACLPQGKLNLQSFFTTGN